MQLASWSRARGPALAVLAMLATLAVVTISPIQADDADAGAAAASPDTMSGITPSQDYLDAMAQLKAMVGPPRDFELFELSFEPLAFDQIIVQDRTGQATIYHYITFRLRNEVSQDSKDLITKASHYVEVLKAITKQYESAKIVNNVTLKVAGETILDRQDMRVKTRTVDLSVLVYDQHGSRMRLLETPAAAGAVEGFNFPDQGERSIDTVYQNVKEKVEEKAGRRLYTVDQIRAHPLPPYDPTKVDAEGVATGELYGVILFDQLSPYGNFFTVQVRGLSNKLRFRAPAVEKAKLPDYVDTHVFRREYVMHYTRLGDEHYQDMDTFTMDRGGWEWVDTFQRLKERASVAYATYFLDNIADEQDKPNGPVDEELWKYYDAVRTAHPNVSEDKLPDLEKTLKAH